MEIPLEQLACHCDQFRTGAYHGRQGCEGLFTIGVVLRELVIYTHIRIHIYISIYRERDVYIRIERDTHVYTYIYTY